MNKEKISMCRWYKPCTYGKWETTHKAETRLGWPLLIQQKTCVICGKSILRKSLCEDSTGERVILKNYGVTHEH